jgi:argininosuccinate lyase
LQTFSDSIDAAVFDALEVEQVVNRRISEGGTASVLVEAAVKQAAQQLESESLPDEVPA